MSALTVRLPDDKHERLKALARSRGTTLNRLIEDMASEMLAQHDAEPTSTCAPPAAPAWRHGA